MIFKNFIFVLLPARVSSNSESFLRTLHFNGGDNGWEWLAGHGYSLDLVPSPMKRDCGFPYIAAILNLFHLMAHIR